MPSSAKVVALDSFIDDDESSRAARQTQQNLIDTQERLGMMLDIMPMGLLIHTEQGVLFANQEACRMLQVSKTEVVGQHFLDFVAEQHVAAVNAQFEASFRYALQMQSQETRIARRDGEEMHIRLISGRLPWKGNPVIQVLLQDVTDLKKSEQKLRMLSERDPLTGAYNRRFALGQAQDFLARAGRAGSLGVVLLDADHFKSVNDGMGHAAGDAALVALTRIGTEIAAAFSSGEHRALFSRFGGEEFLALLPGCDMARCMQFAERLRAAVAALPVTHAGRAFSITVSVGVAVADAGNPDLDAALGRADKALYAAKAAGRNRVAVG